MYISRAGNRESRRAKAGVGRLRGYWRVGLGVGRLGGVGGDCWVRGLVFRKTVFCSQLRVYLDFGSGRQLRPTVKRFEFHGAIS